MANFSLTRPTHLRIGTTASATGPITTSSSASTFGNDLGSCRELTFEVAGETLQATSSKNADAVVATAYAGRAATITMVLEEMTSSAMAVAWGLTASGDYFYTNGSASAPTNYCITSGYWPIDGSSNMLVAYKCNIKPGAMRKLGRDQELLELVFDVLADPSASAARQWFGYTAG